jgi:WD40 repeat protein
MPPLDRSLYRRRMQATGVRASRRALLLLGAAGVANALTACGRSGTPATTGASPSPTVAGAERLGQFQLPTIGEAGGLAWSPNGDVLAAVAKGQFALFPASMATGGGGQPVVREGHGEGEAHSVSWSPDGARIVSIGIDETLRFWTAAGEPTHTVPMGVDGPFYGLVRWSPTGNLVAVCNGRVPFFLDVSRAAPGPLVPAGKDYASVPDLAWAPDGNSIYVVSPDKVFRLPVAGGGQPLATAYNPAGIWRSVAVAADGRVVIAAKRGAGDVICVYSADLSRGGPEFKLPSGCQNATAMRFSPDGRRIAIQFYYHGPVGVWEVTGLESRLVAVYRDQKEPLYGTDGLAWQPGTDRVASLDGAGSIHLWRPSA